MKIDNITYVPPTRHTKLGNNLANPIAITIQTQEELEGMAELLGGMTFSSIEQQVNRDFAFTTNDLFIKLSEKLKDVKGDKKGYEDKLSSDSVGCTRVKYSHFDT